MPASATKALPRLDTTGTLLIAGASLLAAMGLEPGQARAQDLIVKYDQSQLLRLPRPATEIIIGNPTIADVTVQGGNMLVVTGKSFGITNIIALDSEKNVIQDQRVMVQRDEVGVVHMTKGVKRESYNCSPQCNPTITVGDDTEFFERTTKMSQTKARFSEGGGGGGNDNGGNQ